MKSRMLKATLLPLSIALILSACSSNSNDTQTTDGIKSGRFIDAPVQGLKFTSLPSGLTGITNAEGTFQYKENDDTTFTLGNGTPISIGTVKAKTLVQVTEMPNWTDLARTLQTLDTNEDPGIINVGQITLPDTIRTQLSALLSSGTGDIDTILDSDNIAAIEVASQPEADSDEPAVDIVNDVVVPINIAIEHVSENIDEDFTTADLSKQVYKRPGYTDNFMYLYEDGSGIDYERIPTSATTTSTLGENFTWAIDANKDLVVTYQDGEVVTPNLLSIEDNKYILTFINNESNETEIGELLKAKPLTVAALDGKILRRITPDDECSAQTFKFTGNTFAVKESCNNGFFQISGNVAPSTDFDNTIEISGTNGNGEAFSVLFSLVEGEITTGSTMKFATVDGINTVGAHFEELEYELSESELEVPPGFTDADFSRQVYALGEAGMILAFESDGTGVEFNDGDGENGLPYESDFTWSIDSQSRVFIDYGTSSGGTVTGTLNAVTGNAITIDVVSTGGSEDTEQTLTLRKALPVTLDDIDNQIFSFGAIDAQCTAMTASFSGDTVTQSQNCGSFSENSGSLSMHPDFDNVVVATFETGGSQNMGFTSLMALVQGDVNTSGKLATVILDNVGGLDVPGVVDFTNVDLELSGPTSFVNSQFISKAYVVAGERKIWTFKDNGITGKEVANDDTSLLGDGNSYSANFDWEIVSDQLILDVQQEPLGNNGNAGQYLEITPISKQGNATTVKIVSDSLSGQDVETTKVLFQALPVSLDALHGKILSLTNPGSDCTARTLKFEDTTARFSKTCPDGDNVIDYNTSMHEDIDDIAVFTDPLTGTANFLILTAGDLISSGALTFADLTDDTIGKVSDLESYSIVTQEAIPE